jgi:uncharacterized protein (DUF305 family)
MCPLNAYRGLTGAANLQLICLPVTFNQYMSQPRMLYAVLATTVACATAAIAQSPPGYTQADVRFMQGMIGHHAQALEMVALIPSRTNRPDLRALGERIRVSQQDEIGLMKQWLRDRSQQIPADMSHGGEHAMHMPGMAMTDSLMPGMLTPQQMTELTNAKGADFEVLFLKDMIQHHEGALTMVAQLLGTTGSGQEPEVFRFAAEVDTDQRAEIARMNALLNTLQHPTPTPTTR